MPPQPAPPSRLLLSLLIALGVYPLVTILGGAAQALLPGWTVWQRNLVVVPVTVLAMVYALIPAITWLLGRRARRGAALVPRS